MLEFSLSPENCSKLHDALLCLAKFSDSVSVEARSGQLALTALNLSKSAYVSMIMEEQTFFTKYTFIPEAQDADQRFVCRVLNKALLSVFKSKLVDIRGKETAIERCDVSVHDEDNRQECRLVVQMICKHGVTKTYKLTYEPIEMMHALFDKNRAKNRWKIQSRILREFIEYFGPKTEHLDIYAEDGKVTLTSYTEKITNGREILKQPLQTAVSVDTHDFEQFDAEEMMHIAISIKDFRNMVIHADTLRTTVSAMYSQPPRPLQFAYGMDGMRCEYTLMTVGDFHGAATTALSRSATRNPQALRRSNNSAQPRRSNSEMPPPQRPATGSATFGQLNETNNRADPDPDSLFLPDDDDQQWGPLDQRGEDEDMLGWDATANDNVLFQAAFDNAVLTETAPDSRTRQDPIEEGIQATQRASQVKGLFD